jgi:retinol dehydrogenase 14
VDAFADMSCQAGVRALAVAVRSAYPRLDALVNNVGGFWATRHLTADGLERTFAVNHLAAFLLTGLVLDRLKGSAPARIVTVSSNAQAAGRLNFDDLQREHSYSGQRAYSQSKLANVVFTYELARRLEGTGVTATALHPGLGFSTPRASWCTGRSPTPVSSRSGSGRSAARSGATALRSTRGSAGTCGS